MYQIILKTALCIIVSLLSEKVFCQRIVGRVVDFSAKQPVKNCGIYLPELNVGTITDQQGMFILNFIPKRNNIAQFSMVGYKTKLANLLPTDSIVVVELETSHLELKEVVVSTPFRKLEGENSTAVERKDMKQLLATGATSLADALTAIGGVEQQTTGVGISKPMIRGLSGNRIVTYAQDVRQENQQWGDEHGLGIGDLGIEAVEIIKGPSSLLYGSDALGGVVYFVEERYAKQNTVEGYLNSNFQTNNQGLGNVGAVKVNRNKIKLNVFGGYNSTIDFQLPNKQRATNSRFNEANFKTAVGYTTKNWIANLRYSYIKNYFGITDDSLTSENKQREIELPFQKIDNHQVSIGNTFYLKKSSINLLLGYGRNNRNEHEAISDTANLMMKLSTFSYNLRWTKTTKNEALGLTFGLQGMRQSNKNYGIESLIPDATTNDVGLFAVLNGKINNVNFQGGVRLDQRHIVCQELFEGVNQKFNNLERTYTSPNFSVGFSYIKNNFALRANIANGFRSPNTSELASNGMHEGTNRYEIGNENMKIEQARQLDISLDYTDEHLQVTLNPFMNQIQNYIYLSPTQQQIDGVKVYRFEQKNAILYGGEAGVHYHPHKFHWLHLESNISSVFAQDFNKNPLPRIPATRINTTVKAEFKNVLKEIYLNGIYKFGQNRIGAFETPTPQFFVLNAGLNLEIMTKNKPIELSFVLRNALNQKYIDHLSRLKDLGISNQGINFVVGLRLGITQRL